MLEHRHSLIQGSGLCAIRIAGDLCAQGVEASIHAVEACLDLVAKGPDLAVKLADSAIQVPDLPTQAADSTHPRTRRESATRQPR
jgi:hypothetical protein